MLSVWFAWLFYVLFGGVALCYLLIGLMRLAGYMGYHGPYCKDLSCTKKHWPEAKRREIMAQEYLRKILNEAREKYCNGE